MADLDIPDLELPKKEVPNFDFNKIDVSTKTIIGVTNWALNIGSLFSILPTTEYIIVPKKRGRKKKDETIDPNNNLPEGSIITLKFQDDLKGVDLKPKKKKEKENKYFRNSLTVVMFVDGKLINFKITKNGKFQLTGCKSDNQAERCIIKIWDYIIKSDKKNEIITYTGKPRIIILPVLSNIDFSLGFTVNRENLNNFINDNTAYVSLFEPDLGYTGVNIKIPLDVPSNLLLKTLTLGKYRKGKKIVERWRDGTINYDKYINELTDKEQVKEMKKDRYHTLLVFRSGNVIMSSMNNKIMAPTFNEFINIIRRCRNDMEEKKMIN